MLKQNIDYKKLHVVKKSDVSAFAATHYHMSGRTVDREVDMEQVRSLIILCSSTDILLTLLLSELSNLYVCLQPDAHEEAELEARRLQELQREEKQRREEQLEKARLRGKQALKREHLVQVSLAVTVANTANRLFI